MITIKEWVKANLADKKCLEVILTNDEFFDPSTLTVWIMYNITKNGICAKHLCVIDETNKTLSTKEDGLVFDFSDQYGLDRRYLVYNSTTWRLSPCLPITYGFPHLDGLPI